LALQNAKARIKVLEAELKSIKWEHEVLEQKFEQVFTYSLAPFSFIFPPYPISAFSSSHLLFPRHLYLFIVFQVQKERDDLYNKFVSSIYEVQQKSGLKNMLLEKKLETLSEALESKV
jgi:hypothetical protein